LRRDGDVFLFGTAMAGNSFKRGPSIDIAAARQFV
jgi:hypothetical protein